MKVVFISLIFKNKKPKTKWLTNDALEIYNKLFETNEIMDQTY